MEIKVPESLKILSAAFEKESATLYIVGGYIRNAFLNLPSTDIDICSNLIPDKVISICKRLKLKADIINKKLGTVLIQDELNKFEYTCFRIENYEKGGSHSPIETKFVEDIKLDAGRRDFTINALYYNIKTKEILDFYNGLKDISKNKLKAIKSPKEVFESDGLRILRLIRFALEYGLKIDRKTLATAKNYNFQLKDISKERIIKELEAITTADLKYGLPSKFSCIDLFNQLNLYKYIFNSSFEKFEIKQLFDKKHISKENRYIYFALLVLQTIFNNTIQTKEQIQFQIHKTYGENGLKDSNEVKNNLQSIYYIYQYKNNLSFLEADPTLTLNLLTDYSKLSDNNLNILNETAPNLYIYLLKKSEEIRMAGIPLKEEELNISNKKLIDSGINPKNISKIKRELFILCLNQKLENNEVKLIEAAKHFNSIFSN